MRTVIKFNNIDMYIKNYDSLINAEIGDLSTFSSKSIVKRTKLHKSYIDIFNAFILLGKKLYNKNPNCINKIGEVSTSPLNDNLNNSVSLSAETSSSLSIVIYGANLFIYKKDSYTKEWDNILFEFIQNNEVPYYYSEKMKKYFLDKDNLIDFALLSYLVTDLFSDLLAPKKAIIKKGNRLFNKEFSSIYEYVSQIINVLKVNDLDNQLLLKVFETLNLSSLDLNKEVEKGIKLDNSKLKYQNYPNKDNYKLFFSTTYETIFGLVFRMINMHIYGIFNEISIIKFCDCGSIISGRSKRCDDCKRLFDVERKKRSS